VQSRGAEVSSAFKVTPEFRVNLNAALADTHIKSFPNAACFAGQTVAQGCVNGTQGDLSGLPLPYASRWKATANADYTLPLPSLDLNFGAFYRYQSSQHYDVLGDPLTYQGGFGIVNLYLGPQSHADKWSVQLFVNNVLNHTYYGSLAHSTFYALNGANPMVTAGYDRSSFRYGGVRAQVRF
jgi:iron complex outermembrane receptor protein